MGPGARGKKDRCEPGIIGSCSQTALALFSRLMTCTIKLATYHEFFLEVS